MTRAILIASAVLLSVASSLRAADVERTAVFTSGQDGYHTYRIPAAIMTKAGTLLAFAEGRKTGRGDSGDIDLLLKRSTDGGKTFGAQQILWDDADNTCGNPCPVVDQRTGRIVLLMTHNLGSDTEKTIKLRTAKGTRTVWVSVSDDEGLTWSAPREITAQVKKPEWTWYATGPGVGIQLKNGPHAGRLVIPCDYVAEPGERIGNSHVIFSDDGGLSWHIGGEPPQKEFNESQVVELSAPPALPGRLMLNMRNHRPALTPATPRQRGVAISEDGGVTFGEARRDPTLIEPVCQASILRFGETRILFANPASTAKREKMTVRVSGDDGQTWTTVNEIHAGPSAYSCLVLLPDQSVGLLYECGTKNPYERIELARFTPAAPPPAPAPAGRE
jgi:sialidase-1